MPLGGAFSAVKLECCENWGLCVDALPIFYYLLWVCNEKLLEIAATSGKIINTLWIIIIKAFRTTEKPTFSLLFVTIFRTSNFLHHTHKHIMFLHPRSPGWLHLSTVALLTCLDQDRLTSVCLWVCTCPLVKKLNTYGGTVWLSQGFTTPCLLNLRLGELECSIKNSRSSMRKWTVMLSSVCVCVCLRTWLQIHIFTCRR